MIAKYFSIQMEEIAETSIYIQTIQMTELELKISCAQAHSCEWW